MKPLNYEKRRLILPILLSVLVITSGLYVPRERKAALDEQQQWVDSVYNAMSEDERLGQLFMLRAHSNLGQDHIDKIKRLISEYRVGGLCVSGHTGKADRTDQRIPGWLVVPLLISPSMPNGVGHAYEGKHDQFPQQLCWAPFRTIG